VQRLPEHATAEEQIGRHTRRVWKDAAGEAQLEAYSIAGMAHGVPLATVGADACGVAGPFFLEVGVSNGPHRTLLGARYRSCPKAEGTD
jgi:poly(3-hydroxybutyrate) depolymerase